MAVTPCFLLNSFRGHLEAAKAAKMDGEDYRGWLDDAFEVLRTLAETNMPTMALSILLDEIAVAEVACL